MYAGLGRALLKWLFFGRILLTVGWRRMACRFKKLRYGFDERVFGQVLVVVCTENLNPDIMVMKSAENRV
jgi:hypothetical protein